MEKDKIVHKILNEWAMRSPNGLADGHATEENKKALENILSEYGLSKNVTQDIIDMISLKQ